MSLYSNNSYDPVRYHIVISYWIITYNDNSYDLMKSYCDNSYVPIRSYSDKRVMIQ